MIELYYIVVILISFGAAFFSGLLGISGGIIIFPAFLYLVPFLGFESFTVNEITGIAAAQSLAGVFFAFMNHRKMGNINPKLVKKILPVGMAGGLTGTVFAKFITEQQLLIIYFILLLAAGFLVMLPRADCPYDSEECKLERPIATYLLVFCGTAISGALGFAGAVTFIPILNYFCNTPIKVAISTTIFIVLITTTIVFLGKALLGLVPFELIIFILIGALFGANVGTKVNKLLSPHTLRIILMLVILVLGLRILFTIFEY